MINVFIVDDHDIVREGMKRVLESQSDMEVVGEASNGNDVMKGISETNCNVLLLDLNIPGRQGAVLIKEIRKTKPKVKTLIISSNPEDKFVLPLLRAGAMGYISKNADLNELLTAIRKVNNKGKYLSTNLAEDLAFDVLIEDIQIPRKLSELESKILLLIAKGKEYNDIADELAISLGSVAVVRRKIMGKLNLKNNVQLTHYALKNNLIHN